MNQTLEQVMANLKDEAEPLHDTAREDLHRFKTGLAFCAGLVVMAIIEAAPVLVVLLAVIAVVALGFALCQNDEILHLTEDLEAWEIEAGIAQGRANHYKTRHERLLSAITGQPVESLSLTPCVCGEHGTDEDSIPQFLDEETRRRREERAM